MAIFEKLTSLFGSDVNPAAEYKRFKTAMERNPNDHGLKTQFINFCLLNRFTNPKIKENYIDEALALFETLSASDIFDLQCHYLVGKYYQEEKEARKAYGVYQEAIKLFNRSIGQNPNLRSDNAELAYSIALNLLTLQATPADPELQKCFKILRKSYPLHVKRIELENEMSKPVPDQSRVDKLTDEIRRLKDDEELISLVTPKEQPVKTARKEPEVLELVFSKPEGGRSTPTASEPMLEPLKRDVGTLVLPEEGKKEDFFKLTPSSGLFDEGTAFMVYREDKWEGPFTPLQLRQKGFVKPATWVCRAGSQHVIQAYEVPDLLPLN